jgi:predicted PhzF superfamily epimerase YddE/YHI9
LPVTDISKAARHQARQKLAEAEQKNERASAALIEALATVKATIDEAYRRTQDTDTSDLLINLLTEEEVKEARQDAAGYAKRLLADFDAARDEMNARFAKAIAADKDAN